jgi:hypothetical protein
MSHFTDPKSNYGSYRNYIKRALNPNLSKLHNVIPYLGLYLKDLTFIEDGNASFNKTGAVNFFKMR